MLLAMGNKYRYRELYLFFFIKDFDAICDTLRCVVWIFLLFFFWYAGLHCDRLISHD